KRFEPPNRVYLGGWPSSRWRKSGMNGPFTLWEWTQISMRGGRLPGPARPGESNVLEPDSAVALYWDPKRIEPGAKRNVGVAYGLGAVSSQESGGKLLLTVGGRMTRDTEFTLTALVSNPADGENLTITLPDGLTIMDGRETQDVPRVAADAARRVSAV